MNIFGWSYIILHNVPIVTRLQRVTGSRLEKTMREVAWYQYKIRVIPVYNFLLSLRRINAAMRGWGIQ